VHTTTQLAAEVMQSGSAQSRVAHAALFRRVLQRVHRFFRRMVWEPGEAEECLARTLLLLEESLVEGKYEAGRSFNTWLWLKARTVYAQWCRERERRPTPLPAEPATASEQEREEQRLDANAILARVRADLGEESYEAFLLYYEGGLTQAEVAAALGRDRKTIRTRIAEVHAHIDRILGT
jgi:RNA polymerase sigma factor (sigma-70 family)